MSHHESEMNPETAKLLKEMFGLGATGKYPEGKITSRDEGELKLAIGHNAGKVVLSFGKEVAWIGFNPEQALQIAASLIEHAKEAQK